MRPLAALFAIGLLDFVAGNPQPWLAAHSLPAHPERSPTCTTPARGTAGPLRRAAPAATMATAATRGRGEPMGAREIDRPPQGPAARGVTPPAIRPVGAALLVGVAYYAGAQLGFALRFPGSPISMLWPPNAILLAAFLLAPTRRWWALVAGALPAHLVVQFQHGVPLVPMVGLFLTNCGQGLLGAAALRHLAPGPFRLDSVQRFGLFMVWAALLAPLAIAFAAAALIVGTGWGADYWATWRGHFLSNVLTLLALVPAVLGLAASQTAWLGRAALRRCAELGLLLAGLAATTGVVFSDGANPAHLTALLYLPLPFFLWAALRFGTGGVAVAVLVVAGWAVIYAARGPGPFGGLTPFENVVSLQIYLISVAVPLLALAALLRERAAAAGRLRASEARFRSLAELSPDAILIIQGGHYVYANRSAARICGAADPGELVGRRPSELVGPADQGRIRARLGRVLAGEPLEPAEFELTRLDGARITVDALGGPVSWDGAPAAQVLWRDATARQAAEAARRESEARFRTIFLEALDAIVILDDEGHFLQANPAACDLFGMPDEAGLQGRWLWDFAPLTSREAMQAGWARLLTGGPRSGAFALQRPDGGTHTVEYRATPGFQPGRHLAILRDVTERARAAAERAAARRELAAARETERVRLARELHDTAVQQLLGISFQLAAYREGGALPGPIADARRDVLGTVASLRGILRELRPPGLEEFGLVAALDGYLSAVRRERGDALPAIVVDLDHVGDDLSRDVALCLFRVAQEALQNALRHAAARAVAVRLRRGPAEVAVTVRDDGSGFAVPPRLTAYTQQGHFGLAGMAERAQLLGGQLAIESAPGAGTTVTARLPLDALSERGTGAPW